MSNYRYSTAIQGRIQDLLMENTLQNYKYATTEVGRTQGESFFGKFLKFSSKWSKRERERYIKLTLIEMSTGQSR